MASLTESREENGYQFNLEWEDPDPIPQPRTLACFMPRARTQQNICNEQFSFNKLRGGENDDEQNNDEPQNKTQPQNPKEQNKASFWGCQPIEIKTPAPQNRTNKKGQPTSRNSEVSRPARAEGRTVKPFVEEQNFEEYLKNVYVNLKGPRSSSVEVEPQPESDQEAYVLHGDSEEPDEFLAAADYDYVMIEGVLDSGSVDHVMDPAEAVGYVPEPSPGSLRGQKYTGAGGEKIRNDGQMHLHMIAENEHTEQAVNINSTVQAAVVKKPLFSVGKICDNGLDVLFRAGYAVTIDPKTGKEVTRHPREHGTYKFKAKLKAPPRKENQQAGFQRQG